MKTSVVIAVVLIVIVVAAAGGYLALRESAPSAEREKFLVGATSIVTGEYGSVGLAQVTAVGYELERINEFGVAGTTIDLIWVDCGLNPAITEVRNVKSLVTGMQPDVIWGAASSALPPLLGFTKEHRVPMISAIGGTTELDKTDEWHWRFNPSDSVAGAARGVFVYENFRNTKIALVYSEAEGPKVDSLACKDAMEKLGIEIAEEISIVPQQTSYKETVRKLQGAGIETMVIACEKSTGIQFFRDCADLDFYPNIVGSNDICSPEVIEATGDYMEGAIAAFGGYDSSTKWYKEWEASVPFDRWEADGIMLPGSWELIYATYNRDAMVGLALAFEYAQSHDPEAIIEAIPYVCNPPGVEVGSYEEGATLLREGKDINFQGASGPIDFNEYGNVLAAGSILVVKDGIWQEVGIIPAEVIAEAIGWAM